MKTLQGYGFTDAVDDEVAMDFVEDLATAQNIADTYGWNVHRATLVLEGKAIHE